jgi:hypothetical protein
MYELVTRPSLCCQSCGALFSSGFRDLILPGTVNLAGLLVVMAIRRYAFTSIWRARATVVSVIIYLFFRQRRANRPGNYLSVS